MTYFTYSSISRHWELFKTSKIVYWSFFLQQPPRCSWSLSGICKSVIEISWEEVFMVRNTVEDGQSWCSTVICTKRTGFDMQFHLIVVSIFLKTCVKDYITANKSAPINTNQILLSSNRLEVSPWSFTHVFKKIETTMRWNYMSKALRLVQITIEHQDCQFFTLFLTIKTSSKNISITLLQISLKLHEHRSSYRR